MSNLISTHSLFYGFLGLAILPGIAKADWKMCNRTSDRIHVAVAFDPGEQNGGLYARGWTIMPGGACRVVVESGFRNDPPPYAGVFYYAQSDRGLEWKGNGSQRDNSVFCVNPRGNFQISNRDLANDPYGFRHACERRGFSLYNFVSGAWRTGDYTINLDGPSPRGSTRIDP